MKGWGVMGNEGRARAGRPPVGHVAVVVVLLLAVSGVAAACSSSSRRGGLSSACNDARRQFVIFSNETVNASNSASDAWNHWTDIYNRALHGQISQQEIGAGITEYNADFQKTQAAAKKVIEDSTTFVKAYGSCKQSTMPKACQDEFAQYQPLITHATREAQAVSAVFQAIDAQIAAVRTGNRSARNDAVTQYNAALAAHGATVTEHNNLHTAFKAAQTRCSKA
jgi:hypothetical protein